MLYVGLRFHGDARHKQVLWPAGLMANRLSTQSQTQTQTQAQTQTQTAPTHTTPISCQTKGPGNK
jgi:hypothetical protein